MANGLKIYACTGIGTLPQEFNYWLDNTQTVDNTKAVNGLLAKINLIRATLGTGEVTEEETIKLLKILDLYVVCLEACKTYSGGELERAGEMINELIDANAFEFDSLDQNERNDNLDNLITHLQDKMTSGNSNPQETDFLSWWKTYIIPNSKQGFTEKQRLQAKRITKKISGTDEEKDPSDMLFNCGGYYLYMYIDDREMKKLPYQVYKKAQKQKEVYRYVHTCYDDLMPKEDVDNIITAGICKQYKHTPEYVIKSLTGKDDSYKGIGDPAAIIQAIVALVTLLITIITMILSFVAETVSAQYAVPDDPDSAIPEEDGWSSLQQNYKRNKYLTYGLIAGGILLLLSWFKK